MADRKKGYSVTLFEQGGQVDPITTGDEDLPFYFGALNSTLLPTQNKIVRQPDSAILFI